MDTKLTKRSWFLNQLRGRISMHNRMYSLYVNRAYFMRMDVTVSSVIELFCCTACFVRNFSLPLLLFGEVLRGRLQQGQI